MDIPRCSPLVFAVVPFHKIGIDHRLLGEAGQFARPAGPLERTREDVREIESRQTLAELTGIASPRAVSGMSVKPVC